MKCNNFILYCLILCISTMCLAEQTTLIFETAVDVDNTWPIPDIYSDKICDNLIKDNMGGLILFKIPWGVAALYKQRTDGKWLASTIIADNGFNRLVCGESYNGSINTYGSYGTGNGQFQFPQGIAADVNGNIFVADFRGSRIVWLTYDITTNTISFKQNITGGNLLNPKDVDIDDRGTPTDPADDAIWVTDWTGNKLIKYKRSGNIFIYDRSISELNGIEMRTPSGISLVSFTEEEPRLYVINDNGKKINGWEAPTGSCLTSVETDHFGNVWAVDAIGKIHKFGYYLNYLTSIGNAGSNVGQFLVPKDFAVARSLTNNGNFYKSGSVVISEKWTSNTGGQTWVIGADIVNLTGTYDEHYRIVSWDCIVTDNAEITAQVINYNTGAIVATLIDEGWHFAGALRLNWYEPPETYGKYYLRMTITSSYSSNGVPTVNNKVITSSIIEVPVGYAINFHSGFESNYIWPIDAEYPACENVVEYNNNITSYDASGIWAIPMWYIPHSGLYSYLVKGYDQSSSTTNDYIYWRLFNRDIKITENSVLYFWRRVRTSPGGQGRIFIDAKLKNGKVIRDIFNNGTYLCDQKGKRIHPSFARPDPVDWNSWCFYAINLSSLTGEYIDYIMIGYDDDNNESGSFEVFFDDVTIEQYYPYKNQWYAERFGGNSKIDLSFNTDNYEGGAELKLNVLETTSPGTWVNGPLLRNNIDDVPVAPNMRVTWEQYDRNHSLLFELLVQGSDGQDRWLIYGANASNHWDTDQGFVDMGIGQKLPEGSGMPRASRLNVWEKFSRNINDDYFAEFDVSASSIKELRLGHFSYTGWSVGDHGGTVKNIEFTDVPVTSFVSGFEEGQYTPFADTTYENTIVPYFAGPVGAENGVNPHAGNKMYKIQGTDVNLPIAKVAAVSGAIDGKTFWNVYDPYVKIGKGSCLSFWMHVYASPTNYGQIFVDATTKSGKRFSQLIAPSNIYLCDNSGMRITPSVHKAAMGEWVNYVVNLSNSTAYPTGLENEIIDRLMIGYDDAVNDQKGNFVAYIDDIQILPNLPVYDQWSVAHFGGDPNATIGWQEQTGGGAKLVMDNNGGSVGWVNGPWAIKELFLPVSVLFDGIVNWSQYDPTHALLFALKISGADGKERWLCYSSNGQNHAGEISNDGTFGYVNMETTEAYNVWQDFSRNIYTDYNNLFTVVPRKVVAIGLGHFSYASWDGDLGGAVRDIAFRRQDRRWYTLVDIQNELALAYNNAEKITVSTDGLLHLSYSGEDSVYYTSSGDDGQTWTTPYAIEGGSLPVIAVDSKNAPAISWIKQWEPNLGGGVYFSYKTASGWSPADTLTFMDAVPWDYICGYSPPSMSITNDTVSLVYEKSYGGGIPPYISKGWALHQIRFALGNVNAKKDTVLDQYTYTVPPPWAVPTSASMATDYKGNDHIAWHKLGKIYYSMRKIDGTYSPIVEISGPGSAENPSINISGVANVVWEEDGDIYKRTGYDQKWDPIINISQSSSASMMPYICGSDILWTEDVSNDYEVFKTTYSTEKMTYVAPDNLSSTDYASIFPHEFKVQTAIGTKTYCIWAEEIEPAVLWGLTFMVDTTALEPVYAVDVGQETPSIFNVQRNGFIIYESQAKTDDNAVEPYKTVDYDSTELIYCFDNVDPNKKHKILLSFYHESGDDIKMKPYVNDLPLGEIKVKSGEEVILDKQLSEASNRDGQIIVRIEKSKGTMAVCGKILIHEVIKGNGNGKGGAQLAELGNIGQTFIYKLFQNAPNPFNGQTRISYQLAKPGNVSLKIYNTLGQLVNTLVEGHQQPGIYAAIWNGRDNSGRTTANGVYFYRLEAGDFKATKKMVILK